MIRRLSGAFAAAFLASALSANPPQMAFSLDGRRLGAAISRGDGQAARVWVADLPDNRLIMEFQPEYDVMSALALSRMGNAVYIGLPDGRIAVVGPGASEIDLWQAHDGPVIRLYLLLPPMSDLNTFLVSAEPGGRIRGWANGRARLIREFSASGPISDVQPVGRTAVAALLRSGYVEVFDLETSRMRTPLEETSRTVARIAGSPFWPHLVGVTSAGVMIHWQGAGLAARSFELPSVLDATELALSASGRMALVATRAGELRQVSLLGEMAEDRLVTPRRIEGIVAAPGAAMFGIILDGRVYQLMADPGDLAETQGAPVDRLRVVDPIAAD